MSIARSAVGPQFAKVFIRTVNWAVDSPSEDATWTDPFTVVEIPLDGTIEDLAVRAVCRWGRCVMPSMWTFIATNEGRLIDENPVTTELKDSLLPKPLDPSRRISEVPRITLPMCFVVMSKPSVFVPQSTVDAVLQAMQDIVFETREKAEKERKLLKHHLKEAEAARKANVAQIEERRKRNEVKAILKCYETEEQRLVEFSEKTRVPSPSKSR